MEDAGQPSTESARVVPSRNWRISRLKEGDTGRSWSRQKRWQSYIPTDAECSTGVSKFIQSFHSNNILSTYLQVCAVLHLNLFNNPKVGVDFPFMVHVGFGVEPSEIKSFVKLYLGLEPVGQKLEFEGMIQVNHFSSHLPGQFENAPLTPKDMEMWLSEKKHGGPVGLLEIISNNDHSITTPFFITHHALSKAKNAEPISFSGINGLRWEKPMSIAACIEFINTHVRADKQNQLNLRTEMTEADIEIVRGAADHGNNEESVCFLREKMVRERLYANIPLPTTLYKVSNPFTGCSVR